MIRHRKRLRLYSVFFPLFTHKRVVKQLSSTHPLFCWSLKSKHSLIRREHHSLTAHRNIHPTPLISFQNPVAYAIYWAVWEILSNFSSWFSKPVSKKGKNMIQCLSIDWVLFVSPFWMWTGRKYLPTHGQRTEWQEYSTLSLWMCKGSRYSQSFPLSVFKFFKVQIKVTYNQDKTLLASWFCLVHEEFPSFSLFCPTHLPWGN